MVAIILKQSSLNGYKLEETAMRDLVPKDMRDRYIFIDADGTQVDKYIPPSERGKRRLKKQ